MVGAITPAFAWTGSKLMVWGGAGYHTETSSCVPCGGGGVYDPKSNSWGALTSIGAPIARDWTAGVWTGKYFMTWGGMPAFPHQLSVLDQTGGMYDLAGDSWLDVSSIGQPAWRWQHIFEWTGREVLVWGGTNAGNDRLCDGGRFDPVRNAWKPISTDGAPIGCLRPASVWTGQELLVWGGTKRGEPPETTNTGAAYNPDTDSWRPISNQGAPSARHKPATVWTGEEMIVYGGNAGVDARAYNPATDRWRSLSLKGAPGEYSRGDAIWTGSEMILWGNSNCGVGGRYDLASDTWKPFSSKGALSARTMQTLVWTGEAMIVYGGTVGTHHSRDTNSGAMYVP
jgi:hypothetical protein